MVSTHPHHPTDYSQTPLVVTWEVTQACSLTCDHCRAAAQPDRHPDELTTDEGRMLIDQISSFGDPTPIFVISGGDPLERPDLSELIDHATDLGMRVGVTPAPTHRLTPETLEQFVAAGVHRIALSLDGATPDRHDTFRGEAGSFDTIEAAARHASDIGLDLQINTTVTATTMSDLPDIADLVEAFGAVMWEVFFLVPIGRGTELEQLTPLEAEELLHWLYHRQHDAPFRLITVEAPQYRRVAIEAARAEGRNPPRVGSTGDGRGFVFVSHTGEVYPSGFLPISAGNVRDDSIVDIYRDAPTFIHLRDSDRLGGHCGSCRYRAVCGGSRARAFAATGDPMAADPLCAYADEAGSHAG